MFFTAPSPRRWRSCARYRLAGAAEAPVLQSGRLLNEQREIAKSAGDAGLVNRTSCRMRTFSIVIRQAVCPNEAVFCVFSTAMCRTHASLTARIRSSVCRL